MSHDLHFMADVLHQLSHYFASHMSNIFIICSLDHILFDSSFVNEHVVMSLCRHMFLKFISQNFYLLIKALGASLRKFLLHIWLLFYRCNWLVHNDWAVTVNVYMRMPKGTCYTEVTLNRAVHQYSDKTGTAFIHAIVTVIVPVVVCWLYSWHRRGHCSRISIILFFERWNGSVILLMPETRPIFHTHYCDWRKWCWLRFDDFGQFSSLRSPLNWSFVDCGEPHRSLYVSSHRLVAVAIVSCWVSSMKQCREDLDIEFSSVPLALLL